MVRLALIALIFFTTFHTVAQRPAGQRPVPIKITGTVLDQDTGGPLEYATLVLQSIRNPDKITGGVTDINGKFEVETLPGRFNVRVEYIAYKTYAIPEQTFRANTDLGTIRLALDVEQLEAVEVIGEKTTVELRLDKKIYNVGKDLTVRGGTVSDVLDNVPSVSVDVEGNVQLRGNDDVRILINGKPSAITGLNSTEALRQLPAESIEKVEVITSPSARYDAEGSGGIINIILRRSKLLGLNGALTSSLGYPWQAGINGNLNYRVGDFNIFTNTGYNYRESPGNSLNATSYFDPNGDFTNSIREDRNFERVRKGLNANFGVEWYVDESLSITQSVFIRSRDNTSETTNDFSQIDIFGGETSGFRRDDEVEDDDTFQYSFNFNKKINDSGHEFSLEFQYETSEEVEASNIIQNDFDSERVRTAEDQRRVFLQSDYVLPIGENSQFELGYRGDFNRLNTDYDVTFIQPTIQELRITNPSNVLDFKETINAFYTQFGSKVEKISYLLGLRYETTRLIIDQQETNDFNRNNFDGLFPTVNINFEISDKESYSLGYNRRIRRPRSRFLNPFPSRSSPVNLFQGNPNLTPAYSNQVDLGYLNRFEKVTLNASVYFQRATDVITFITENTGETTVFDGQDVPIIRRTPVNLAKNDRYGFEFTTNYRPTKKWNLNGNFNLFNLITRGTFNNQNFDAENVSWFVRLNNKITLPKGIDWQTRVNYRGPTENAQTRNKGILSMDLAFSKDLFKEKGSLAFNISDVFNSRRRISETFTPAFFSDSEFQWRVRSFNLAFTYRFNQKKPQRQGRQRNGDDGDFEFDG
ncbi:TonB-dependent receptor [Flavobacteriaceae bacterium TP-CH-4]|uniref:TonB-dependent receptor n=1 Tax=Pelagihabitans pacificus TaxID=2696054 RepID=A0A967ASL4_9FLAO|nr:outer membrane beta-barrel family protein [Pelagihabitans pacificus]NHF59212.1 TonB-dependent receptor [Pelagihabitans pacificus]